MKDVYFGVGGKREIFSNIEIWNFGWIPPWQRTVLQHAAHAYALAEMPGFHIEGKTDFTGDKACLFELWQHPQVVSSLGFEYPGVHQLTGSCVGAGGANCVFTLSALEVIRLKDPEQILVPFWLLPYGRSRYYAGMRGRGEGSLGSAFAKAMRVDGILPANLLGLPTFTNSDGLQWSKSVEYEWSDGERTEPTWLEQSRRHLVQTTAKLSSADQVREALVNGYPCTDASMFGADVSVVEDVLLGRRGPTWSHQTSILGWWKHARLGELFWYQNQWGLDVHGRDPAGGPPGGFWITYRDMDWIAKTGEVFAFSQFSGFPAQKLSWYI